MRGWSQTAQNPLSHDVPCVFPAIVSVHSHRRQLQCSTQSQSASLQLTNNQNRCLLLHGRPTCFWKSFTYCSGSALSLKVIREAHNTVSTFSISEEKCLMYMIKARGKCLGLGCGKQRSRAKFCKQDNFKHDDFISFFHLQFEIFGENIHFSIAQQLLACFVHSEIFC